MEDTKNLTNHQAELGEAIRRHLCRSGQRELPYSLLYDDLGSVLFEAISLLPEYGVTRAESRVMRFQANEIVSQLSLPIRVVELGSGTGVKTRWILEALKRQEKVSYAAIDLSRYALDVCEKEMGALPFVTVEKLNLSFLDGLQVALSRREIGQSVLVLFLGSTIGNSHPSEARTFLGEIRSHLEPGDHLLLGVDLQRDERALLLAYDDPTGVTAAFNLNLLGHINRELDSNFDLRSYVHEARYNAAEQRVEMHLRSKREQTVTIPEICLSISIREGETIWTESSYKYCAEDLHQIAIQSRFEPVGQWIDSEWPFSANLWRVAC
jgi:dimethylhistidine N-methyltransferase